VSTESRLLPVFRAGAAAATAPELLHLNPALTTRWLEEFLRHEVIFRRGFQKVVIGISGGVDSALVAFLCARALGPERVVGIRMPYKTSNPESLAHGRLITEALGIEEDTIDITGMVDGYLANDPEADGRRRGNVMARSRMIVLFDQSERFHALPIGTGNKSERLFGYFTWHADDSPPINPLGDLYKTQVWQLSRYLGLPSEIVEKPASADLVVRACRSNSPLPAQRLSRRLAYPAWVHFLGCSAGQAASGQYPLEAAPFYVRHAFQHIDSRLLPAAGRLLTQRKAKGVRQLRIELSDAFCRSFSRSRRNVPCRCERSRPRRFVPRPE
jgi:NAD+ synthetase